MFQELEATDIVEGSMKQDTKYKETIWKSVKSVEDLPRFT